MFNEAGWASTGIESHLSLHESPKGAVGWVTRCHVSKDNINAAKIAKERGSVVVTTIRNPIDIEASWKARGRDKEQDLKRDMDLHQRLMIVTDPFILTFEENWRRDEKLKLLSDHLGVELIADWDRPLGKRKR